MSTIKKRPSEGNTDPRAWEGWVLFGPRDKDGKHKCKLCSQQITYSNSTSSFKNHLKRKHPDHWEEFQDKKAEIFKTQSEVLASRPTILDLLDPVKVELRNTATKTLVRALEQDIVRFIVGDIRPFHAVEGRSSIFLLFPPAHHFFFFSDINSLEGDGFYRLVTRGRPKLPRRLFERHHAKELVMRTFNHAESYVSTVFPSSCPSIYALNRC